jgi:hypothetical protein
MRRSVLALLVSIAALALVGSERLPVTLRVEAGRFAPEQRKNLEAQRQIR